MFATGIEGSYPVIPMPDGSRRRIDEFAKCGHYERWRDDFALVKELEIEFLRYGPPLYRTHLGPERYDWAFTDEAFAELQRLEITPIVDLCHFGVPDWIGDFQNDAWPEHFAEYARAFAKRFPWVRFYTPVNEIFIAATFSAQFGWWNECRSDDRAFVRALRNLCRANILAMHAIMSQREDAVFVQSESSEYFHAENPDARDAAELYNQKRFLALDLTYGRSLDAAMYEYLLDNGMTRDEFHWFRNRHCAGRCVMGNDYYVTNEHLVRADGSIEPAGEIFGYYVITHHYYERYHLPVMHTETNVQNALEAPAWLRKQWANVHRLNQDGVPMLGFTWYSLTDQIDWDTQLREDAGRVNPLGLVDLDRNLRPVGEAFRQLIRQWRDVLPSEPEYLDLRLG
ncbi:MAG TPA: family 1 glycosylhydrolase [Candidatus Elarobacter sp.]|nr:family 1 glycosylhydrolase [Candidatus Elarobacter sp.]